MQMIGKKLSIMRWTRFFLMKHENYQSIPITVWDTSGFKKKLRPDDTIEKYNARLIAKGKLLKSLYGLK
jgi:hypothetical protein